MPLFGPPNVEKLRSRGDVEGLVKALGFAKDPEIPLAAVEGLAAMADRSDAATDALIETATAHDEPTVRRAAVRSLEQSVGVEAFDAILEKLTDEDDSVRSAAARALGRFGDGRALDPLERVLLADGGRFTPNEAARALRDLGDPAAAFSLMLVATDGNLADARREVASEVLISLGDAAVPRLAEALEDDALLDWRSRVVTALGEIGSEKAVDPLVAALGAKTHGKLKPADGYVRMIKAKAATALGKIGSDRATPALISALGAGWIVAQPAAEALAAIGATTVAPLADALGSPSESVRAAAAHALGKLGDPSVLPQLERISEDPSVSVREEVRAALRSLNKA